MPTPSRKLSRKPATPRRAVVLIVVAGVLAVMAALGAAFYTITHMQVASAVRYGDSVRAQLLSQAGLDDAIAEVRGIALKETETPNSAWFTVSYLQGATQTFSLPDTGALGQSLPYTKCMGNTAAPFSDRFTLQIEDAASKINVNAGDNLGVLLDNLCRLVGTPLAAADQDHLQPRRWAAEGGAAALFSPAYDSGVAATQRDTVDNRDIYYALGADGRPVVYVDAAAKQGVAIYGDGYAIAGFRARHGPFKDLADVKQALTYLERNGNSQPDDPLEQMEVELKYAALRPYLTLQSWVDTNTVGVGKFEWVKEAVSAADLHPNLGLTRGCVPDFGGNDCNAFQVLCDRDKSWIEDDPQNDPLNTRGSLRGCYVAIVNGHGAGQLRRIATNGTDWIAFRAGERMTVPPGPISSYVIMAPEDAVLEDLSGTGPGTGVADSTFPTRLPPVPANMANQNSNEVWLPRFDPATGVLVDNPNLDYVVHPLCIHRAPVNLNTASDKVLEALFLGINAQHGHFLALGTDADLSKLRSNTRYFQKATVRTDSSGSYDIFNPGASVTVAVQSLVPPAAQPSAWIVPDPFGMEGGLFTVLGLKRIPLDSGKLVLNRPAPTTDQANFGYLNAYGELGAGFVVAGGMPASEAHELAYRIIVARQLPKPGDPKPFDTDNDPNTADGTTPGYTRGPFKNWDDLYFRVIRPWDDVRSYATSDQVPLSGNPRQNGQGKASLARMLMAHFSSNLDLLKFNPNIEWIDRFGRNFTELEPVMVYTTAALADDPAPLKASDPLDLKARPVFANAGRTSTDRGEIVDEAASLDKQRWLLNPYVFKEAGRTDPDTGNALPGGYIIRNYRYKSDELIDKSDLNRSTTEFSFDSNGLYEVSSLGYVIQPGAGQVLAEHRCEALLKVYDVWRETTQSQFVQGRISDAANQALAWTPTQGATFWNYSGRVTRDASGNTNRKALATLPEPLVPLTYHLDWGKSGVGRTRPNLDVVMDATVMADTTKKRDAFGHEVDMHIPDVVANRVLPARYDGQLVLATNVSSYDPSLTGDRDTFLAQFIGDMDTDTSGGNGREQAKTPGDCTKRTIGTMGLLGLINDTFITMDPGLPDGGATPGLSRTGNALNTFPQIDYGGAEGRHGAHCAFLPINRALETVRLNESAGYWNNVMVRQGDLRADGVWLGGNGVSGRKATVKYLFDNDSDGDGVETGLAWKSGDWHDIHSAYFNPNQSNGPDNLKRNFNPGSDEGNLVTLWFKPAWHHNDNRHHEFFNASNPSGTYFYCSKGDTPPWRSDTQSRACFLAKAGSYWAALYPQVNTNAITYNLQGDECDVRKYASLNTSRAKNNDLLAALSGNCNLWNANTDSYAFKPSQPNYTGTGLVWMDRHFRPFNWDSFGRDMAAALHGGNSNVLPSTSLFWKTTPAGRESPCYRVQPFRWGYVGMRFNYGNSSLRKTSARMRDCENVFVPGYPGTYFKRLFVNLSPEGFGNWYNTGGDGMDAVSLQKNYREQDYYYLPGFWWGARLSGSATGIPKPKNCTNPYAWKSVPPGGDWTGSANWTNNRSLAPRHLGDFIGSWGCWRRPMVAPIVYSPADASQVSFRLGRPPPSQQMPGMTQADDATGRNCCVIIARGTDSGSVVFSREATAGPWLPGVGPDLGRIGAANGPIAAEPPQMPPYLDSGPYPTVPPACIAVKYHRSNSQLIADHYDTLRLRIRPFIDTQFNTEGEESGSSDPNLANVPASLLPNKDEAQRHYYSWWSLIDFRNRTLDAPCDIGNSGPCSFGRGGQDVKYYWADPATNADMLMPSYGSPTQHNPIHKCLSINNFNSAVKITCAGTTGYPMPLTNTEFVSGLYRQTPGADGTYAVIDALKISSKETTMKLTGGTEPATDPYPATANGWSTDRAKREMTTSRYYLPDSPLVQANCPTFTSQTLLQSVRGQATAAAIAEYVWVARVNWSVFTPRFMHEYRAAGTYHRTEYHTEVMEDADDTTKFPVFKAYTPLSAYGDAAAKTCDPVSGALLPEWRIPTVNVSYQQQTVQAAFRGPFDYDAYNDDTKSGSDSNGRPYANIGVNRPPPSAYSTATQYGQPHYTKGVEVELLNNNAVIDGSYFDPNSKTFLACGGTFSNPDVINRTMAAGANPQFTANARVRTDQLQYRVRFRYPVDTFLADPKAGNTTVVDPATQYLLDTPVFDELSVTYFGKPRVLAFREVGE